ncbi:MAG: VWA domain-containing protein, partial [Planctomycetota bacterium]
MIELAAPLTLLLIAPLLYLWWRLGRGPREARPIRAALVLVAVLLVASPRLHTGSRARHVVLLVDRSLSCGRESTARSTEMAGLLGRNMAREDRLSVVTFGRGAAAASYAGNLGDLAGTDLQDASDLSAGLNLARSLLEGRRGGRIFLVSDGLYTGRDPTEAVPALHKAGIAVDFSPIGIAGVRDFAITEVHVPERVQQGQPFELSFVVEAPAAARARVTLQRAGMKLSRAVSLAPGSRRFTVRDVAGRAGLVRYSIAATVEGDARPENNRALAVTQVIGPPRMLVVNQTGEPDNVTRALKAAGMVVTTGDPQITVTSADLKPYAAVVLENVALSSLSDRADAALRNFVRETGGGLLVTGGRRSFAEGGYYQSRLEDVLPVSMMRQEAYQRPRVAMCLVLDRSGSMAVGVGRGLSKMDLANRGAAEAVGVLMPQDQVAVIAVDSQAHRVVPLVNVGESRDSVVRDVLRIESMGGGIFVYTGLLSAVAELMESQAPTRHIVLFADANDSEEPGAYRDLVGKWVSAGGSISVIGLGTERDADAD